MQAVGGKPADEGTIRNWQWQKISESVTGSEIARLKMIYLLVLQGTWIK